MLDLAVEIRTKRTREEAFAYVADGYFEHHGRFDPAVVEMRRTSEGPVAKGATGIEVRRFVTRQEAGFEVTEFERPGRFALRNTSGPFDLERTYAFEPAKDGSSVTFSFRMAPRGGAAKWLFPLMRSKIESQVRANIELLRSELDAS